MTSLRVQVKLINRPIRLEPALQSSVFGTLLLVRGTTHYGYVSQSVGASNTQTTANNPYTRSNLVVCRYGVDEVERITYIHGEVTFYGDSATTLNVTLKNP